MKFTSYLTLFYLLITTDVSSTSTTFDQNLILNDDFKILYSNEKQIINNIQSLAIGGSIAYFGKELYKNGFFSPFGFTPKKYFNLSPLINSKTIKKEENIDKYVYCQKKNIKSKLIHRNLYKEISSNTLNICNTNSYENLEKLINKY